MDKILKPEDCLREARKRYSQKELANLLDVSEKTVSRWESGATPIPKIVTPALRERLSGALYRAGAPSNFTFVDLFAGIGGMRLGFESAGGRCVYTSEWNEFSQKTYRENFGVTHPIAGDITKVKAEDIPDHDVLVAGFPCQPFSIAGVSKKNSLGRAHGFDCQTQGTLFFDIERIISAKRPKAFLLENVKNLKSHDKGRTFEVIRYTLEKKLGYRIFPKVIDGRIFVPQHRERIFIVGFRDNVDFNWDDFKVPMTMPKLRDILHPQDGSEPIEDPYTVGKKARVHDRYTLSSKLWQYLQDYSAGHKAKGNGFGFGLVGKDDVARTLSARYYKDGSEILVSQNKRNPRRLTPRECARLMGFDSDKRKFMIPVSDTQAYKQFGNAVIVPVVAEVARIMAPHLVRDASKPRVRLRSGDLALSA